MDFLPLEPLAEMDLVLGGDDIVVQTADRDCEEMCAVGAVKRSESMQKEQICVQSAFSERWQKIVVF